MTEPPSQPVNPEETDFIPPSTERKRTRAKLAGLFDDDGGSQPDMPGATATAESTETRERTRRRGPVDLSGLYSDEKPAGQAAAPAKKLDFSQLSQPEPAAAPETRERRRPPDLSGLFGEGAAPAEEQSTEGEGGLRLALPSELEGYLPPDLWRRLKSPEPARGVLMNALERVRSVLYLLSTFLPRHLVQEKMRRPFAGRAEGRMLSGTLLFSDVSGFTALSEQLAGLGPEGAERLTAMMNQYFAVMLDILAESDGILLKFAGDALLVFFPEQDGDLQTAAAVRASQRMLGAMSRFARIETPTGSATLKMKIGLASGDTLAASVGGENRMEYAVLGPAITEVMAAEGQTTGGGQIVINPTGAEILGLTETAGKKAASTGQDSNPAGRKLKNGFYLLEREAPPDLDDFEIRADARRARGAIPWNATPQAIVAQMEVALRQIQALRPYLAPELAERVVAQTGKRGVVSQFRPTTTLFCNFTGPEELLGLWGPEGAQRVTSLLNAYFSAMNEVISHYGGIVSRIDPYSKGSKMLALFGAPVAHEDDPQRAVSAALAMNLELEMINESWLRKLKRHLPAEWDQPLIQHRIGITSGQTFAGQVGSTTRREYTVMGDVVNLAARLMSAGEMGRILISRPVAETVEDYFLLTERPPMRVKGKSRPIPAFQVEGPLEDPLLRRGRGRGPLIGRGSALALGNETVRRALNGSGSVLVIQGPAGIGKSHLADELLRRGAGQGARIYAVQGYSYNEDAPHAIFSQLFRQAAGITSMDFSPEMQAEKFERMLERLELPDEMRRPLAELAGIDRREIESRPQAVEAEPPADLAALVKSARRRGSRLEMLDQLERKPVTAPPGKRTGRSREREAVGEAILAGLERLAGEQPTILFLEDAQWVDEDSCRLLERLNQRIGEMPLLVLLARRSEETGDAGRLGRILQLNALEAEGTHNLVAQLLVGDLAQVIFEQTHGNPMMVSEITRWFMHTQKIDAGALRNVLETSDFMQKLVLSSLEELGEARREVIRAAAVIGQEFSTGQVRAVMGSVVDPVSLSTHLLELTKAGHIRQTGIGIDASYAFQQSLVRDILYGSLPHEIRRNLHARLAEYLSQPLDARRERQKRIAAVLDSATGGAAQESELIAYHYEQANRPVEAARYLVKAAGQARGSDQLEKAGNDTREALALLGRALEAVEIGTVDPEIDRLKRAAQSGLGDLAVLSGEYLAALAHYEAATALPGEDENERLRLATRLALMLPLQKRLSGAWAVLQAAAPEPAAVNDGMAAATGAWLAWRIGDPAGQGSERSEGAEAQAASAALPGWIRRAGELFEAAPERRAEGIRAALAEFAGRWDEALEGYRQAGLINLAGGLAVRIGAQRLQSGEPERARELFQQAGQAWSAQNGSPNPAALAQYYEAQAHFKMGELEKARAALEAAQASLENSPPLLQANGRAAIQKAIKLVEKPKARRWPSFDWQAFDDENHILLLFQG